MPDEQMRADVRGGEIRLRPTKVSDLPTFFEHQREDRTYQKIGFGPEDPNDRADHDKTWMGHLANPRIWMKTILFFPFAGAEEIAGNILTFYRTPSPILEVGYTLGQKYWGRGIASAALELILGMTLERPICAACAADNMASIRVLQKAGFKDNGRQLVYGNARKREIVQRHFLLE